MKKKTTLVLGLSLMFAASGQAVSFTRDSGDTSWSNLGQWNDNSSGSFQSASNFPMASDTILLNGGKMLTVDTNAFAGTIRLPNGTSTATLELPVAGKTLDVSSLNVGRSGFDSYGAVNHFAGALVATKLSLQPGGMGTGHYNHSGGTVSTDTLEVGNAGAGTTGTSTFVQSGGSVSSPDITIGGSGSGTYEISGGTLDSTGTLDVITNGQFNVAGTSAVVTATTFDTQPGSRLAFLLDDSGISTVQISGTLNLANASILIDGSSYWGEATDFVLIDAGTLASMASSITITGLVSASVSQVGDTVVLSVVESKAGAVFENTTGDGLWNTPGNWTPVGVPSGNVLARINHGQTATMTTNPAAVDGIIVGSNATLVVQAETAISELRVETQGTLKLDLGITGAHPVIIDAGFTFDPTAQLVIDGSAYEGLDGYFPVLTAGNLVSSLTNQVVFSGFDSREPAAIVESDGLWLRLIAEPSLSERLCSLMPESRITPDYANTTFSSSRSYEPSGSAWSVSFDEAHVLDTRISQEVAGDPTRSWDLRTGRGGFIYSFRTGALGETVPPSWRSTQDTSPWNDEVWQGVVVGPLNDPSNGSPYFMHQSGAYLKDPILTEPFYSPQVASHLDVADRSFTTVNWTPQAHINIYVDDNVSNDWKSYVLCYTRYKDMGQGVVEVMMGYYNYGPDLVNWFNMPWGGVRRTSTEYAFTAEPGGITWSDPVTNRWGTVQDYNTTGGWQGYSATSNGVTPSLGFVFGLDPDPLMPEQNDDSSFRCGYAGGTPTGNETDWRNYFVTTAIRRYNLPQGKGLWSTYYFVLGDDMQDLSDRIQARDLIGNELAAFDFTEASTPLVAYSVSGSGSSFQCLENGSSPDFFLYAYPVTGSFPVFEIIEADESRYLTWNSYANGIVKPYDGTMAGQRLLGFAMPSAGTNGTVAALSGLLPAQNYLADGETLYVRTATPIETWRVEHFGFTDNASEGANTANPDSDKLNNLGEYALGGNPTNGADIGYLPTIGNSSDGVDYVHARRKGSETELAYVLESTSNLISNDWNTATYVELPISGNLDADYEAVTNRIDTAGKTNEFIRLKVEAL